MKNPILILFALGLLACQQEKRQAPVTINTDTTAHSVTVPVPSLSTTTTLYVHARNGLVLRKTPAKDGEKVASLPCDGRPLKVIMPADPHNRYVAEKIGHLEVAGGWVKVQTEDGKEGYLFEGYLSPYPPVVEVPEEGITYLETLYRFIAPKSGPREVLPANPEASEGFRQRFADGAVFESTPFAGGYTETLSIPGGKMSLPQALVLFRNLIFAKGNTQTEYDPETSGVKVLEKEGYEQMTIAEKDGRLWVQFNIAD